MVIDGRAVTEASIRAYLLACYPGASIPPLSCVDEDAAPLVAEVNHGAWIAPCACGMAGEPAPGSIVFLDEPLGWCLRCRNLAAGGHWRRVVVPEPAERALIEAVLACRAAVADRNWQPGETVADLVAQNRAHAEGVPDAVR